MRHRLSAEAIRDASTRIDPVFLTSPQFESPGLSEAIGCSLTIKDETDNPIRCFKGRGADYFLTCVVERGDQRLMVCASTGNFGQAMAYACRKHARPLVVYADEGANPVKMGRISELGAEVRLSGPDFDAAKAAARDYSNEVGAWMIEDGHEPEISEGAGTIALELLDAAPTPPDFVIIPLGNGALLNGNARWIRETSPDTQIVGVCADGADAMEKSWRSGSVVERDRVDTISEGIAVRVPVPSAVTDMTDLVDDVLLVSDQRTIEAMRLIHHHTEIAVEPSAAVGVAAIIDHRERFAGERVATILTGANLSEKQRMEWIGA